MPKLSGTTGSTTSVIRGSSVVHDDDDELLGLHTLSHESLAVLECDHSWIMEYPDCTCHMVVVVS